MKKKLQYIKGDLFTHNFHNKTIIPHVCNNIGAWGSGFVIPLGKHFPRSKERYLAWYKQGWEGVSGPFGLGKMQRVIVDDKKGIYVANMIAQTMGGKRPLNYVSLVECMDKVAVFATKWRLNIVCPKFGSDRAGGDWNFIEQLIEDCWLYRDINVTVYYM